MGLTIGALFSKEPLSKVARQQAEEQQTARELQKHEQAFAERSQNDVYRRLGCLVPVLARKLTLAEEDSGLATLFLRALELQHAMDALFCSNSYWEPSGGCARAVGPFSYPPAPDLSFDWEVDEDYEASLVETEAQFDRFLAAGHANP